MSRISRKYYISSFLHIMVQGINREYIFQKDYFKNLYIKLTNEKFDESNIHLIAFTIMENHAHFLISYEKIEDVSNCMHKINQTFAQMYNKIEDRVGYVFRDRYKCEQIKDESHLYNVLAYIHFNPYKAKLIEKLADYKYSSYIDYIKGNIDKEKAYMIFNTYEYKEIFIKLHKEYFDKYLKSMTVEKTYNDVINEFKLKNKIKSTRIITKENNLLIDLILELENKTTLNDKQIAEVLGIGKNRIGYLKNKLK